MKVSDCYAAYDNVLILHGISKSAPESNLPKGVTLVDQINYCIEHSSQRKLSAFSFVISKHKVSNWFGLMGVIIKEAEILDAFPGDSGLRSEAFTEKYISTGANISEIVVAQREAHNELILRDATLAGIYVSAWYEYSKQDVHEVSTMLNLGVYFLDPSGLYLMIWSESTNTFSVAGLVDLKAIREGKNDTLPSSET